jgi:hypothetical protein
MPFTIPACDRPMSETRSTGAGAPVSVDPPTLDLGEVFLGESRDFRFRVVNTDPRAVEVTDVAAGCPCIGVELNPRILRRWGDVAELSGHIRPNSAGNLRQTLILTLNNERRVTAEIEGRVVRAVEAVPTEIVFQPRLGKPAFESQAVTVHNRTEKSIELKCATPLDGPVRAEPHDLTLPARSRVVLAISYSNEPGLCGEHHAVLFRGESESLQFNVHIRPRPYLTVAPESVRLGVLTRQQFEQHDDLLVQLRGEIVSELQVTDARGVSFLKLRGVEIGDAGLNCFLTFVDTSAVGQADLHGQLEICVRHVPTSRQYAVPIAVSGFLVEAPASRAGTVLD